MSYLLWHAWVGLVLEAAHVNAWGRVTGLIDELSHVVSSIICGREAIEQSEDEQDPG